MISDDEVYRYLPAVVVATVDKMATIAFNPHFSHLTHGPRFRCPDHGYVTFGRSTKEGMRCLARHHCQRHQRDWEAVDVRDPAPALMVQDELHLLSEELGTFAGHYETLWTHLTKAGSHRPSKVVAATATLSDYEPQVIHLYALRPRRFPSEGFEEGRSFYAERLPNLARRLFVGALPSQVTTADFGVMAHAAYRRELARLRAAAPADVVTELGLTYYDAARMEELLFLYELPLFYVNRKTHGDRIGEDLARLGRTDGGDPLRVQVLNGATPLPVIGATIRAIEKTTLRTPADQRLGAVVGTSLVSHGIDLARINAMHVAGMPSTVAYYVQSTARAGRTDVGMVFVALSRSFARDRAVYHFFDPQHRYMNHLIEPVSLNRFSFNGPAKTASGIMAAIIINQIARDSARNPDGHDLTLAQRFSAWFSSSGTDAEALLRQEVEAAYGLDATVLDHVVREHFRSIVNSRVTDELAAIRSPRGKTLQSSFRLKPISSFRDIDDPVEFGTNGPISRNEFQVLSGGRDPRDSPDDEALAPAQEREDADGA